MSTLKVNNVTDLGDDAVITDGALVGAGKILQVVSTVKTDVFTSTSPSFTPVTGFTATITPSSDTNKVLIIIQISVGNGSAGVGWGHWKLSGGNTSAYVGNNSGDAKVEAIFGGNSQSTNVRELNAFSIVFLDSPNTTSSVTYGVQARTAGNGAIFVNRSELDSNSNQMTRGASSFTLMEVAG